MSQRAVMGGSRVGSFSSTHAREIEIIYEQPVKRGRKGLKRAFPFVLSGGVLPVIGHFVLAETPSFDLDLNIRWGESLSLCSLANSCSLIDTRNTASRASSRKSAVC